jgi:hypothetical protein
MSDPFSSYGVAATKPTPPPKLVAGPMTTRAQARTVYAQIVAELAACSDQDTLDIYLFTVGEELLQFETELDFLWSGDGEEFAGLYNEIMQAKLRVSGS